jgi:hypothetical protein
MKLPHWTMTVTESGRTFVPLAVRVAHVPRHGVSVRRSPLRALHSLARSAGDFLVGAFAPVAAAW